MSLLSCHLRLPFGQWIERSSAAQGHVRQQIADVAFLLRDDALNQRADWRASTASLETRTCSYKPGRSRLDVG